MAPLTESRDNIRRAWRRVAGLAQDLILNSGRLSGVVQQIISDTVGSELQLNPKPDLNVLATLGYDASEARALIDLIKREWKYWSWNPRECDVRGKLIVPQMLDIGLRQYLAYGETTGINVWWPVSTRRRQNVRTGTKVLMLPPSRLVQETNEAIGLYQGVFHDEWGRPVQYRFADRRDGVPMSRDVAARNGFGLSKVIHIFEPNEADDVRGISPLAGAFRKHVQHEMLEDATLQMAVLQTAMGIALSSAAPSSEAFEALEALKEVAGTEGGKDVAESLAALLAAQIQRAQEGEISFGTDPRISHLAPGEKLDILGVKTPGPQYEPFNASLSRDMARALGVTYESLTLDNRGATYSSSRVGISSIWPVVTRRRERISGVQAQQIYDNWLDEAVFSGTVPIKGGYEAFNANRDRLCWAQWRGPAKPSADDKKSADAAAKRVETYTSTVEIEAAELGQDGQELREQHLEEHEWYVSRGMRSPYERAGTSTPSREKSEDEDEKAGGAAE
jgi:lambda family phage portal protein